MYIVNPPLSVTVQMQLPHSYISR